MNKPVLPVGTEVKIAYEGEHTLYGEATQHLPSPHNQLTGTIDREPVYNTDDERVYLVQMHGPYANKFSTYVWDENIHADLPTLGVQWIREGYLTPIEAEPTVQASASEIYTTRSPASKTQKG